MDNNRAFKCNDHHWQMIVNHLEQHTNLIKTKFSHFDGDKAEHDKLWFKLANSLNNLGYGKKTAKDYQLALGRWKSKVKTKATAVKLDMQKTGGGPSKAPPLTILEERLMGIIGWRYIVGDKVMELGFVKLPDGNAEASTSNAVPSSVTPQPSAPTLPKSLPPLVPLDPVAPSDLLAPPMSTAGAPKKRVEAPTKRKIPQTERGRKAVCLNRMHCDHLEVLNAMNKNIALLTNAVTGLREDMREYFGKENRGTPGK